jgi:iron complex transport system ATP-binding protein
MSLLRTDRLNVSIAGKNVCSALDLEVCAGERWAVLGRNGIGKTTLLHTLAVLRPADSGEIFLHGQNSKHLHARQIAQTIGLLFQQQEDTFPGTVLETALIGRHPHLGAWQWESDEDHEIALAALKALQLEQLTERRIDTLSGGERQRLALATLLAQQAKLLLLDEPTNHLDIHQQISVLEQLNKWSQEREHTVIMTLHDVNLALRFCSHALLLMGHGEVIAGKVNEVVTEANLERLYLHPLHKLAGEWGQAYLPG